jgi:hypothetical protein
MFKIYICSNPKHFKARKSFDNHNVYLILRFIFTLTGKIVGSYEHQYQQWNYIIPKRVDAILWSQIIQMLEMIKIRNIFV